MGRGWETIEKPNFIGRKYVDKSLFKYGMHIPKEYIPKFLDNIDGNTIELGKSKEIKLLFDDYESECSIRNIDRKNVQSQTIQIRYDGNIEIKEYLKNKFSYTYDLIDNEQDIDTDEYIDIYKGNEINTFYIKEHTHKSLELDKEEIDFINTIKSTSMSKSYKIPLLWAFYNNGNIKLKINEDDIYYSFKEFYSKEENAKDLQNQKSTEGYENWNKKQWFKFVKDRPIKYLLESTPQYFYQNQDLFCITNKIEPFIRNEIFIKDLKLAIESLEKTYFNRSNQTENNSTAYWTISPGKSNYLWNEFVLNNEIRIGWDYLGDLNQYKTREEIEEKIKEYENLDHNPTNNSLANYQFSKVMKKGDIVIVKSGLSKILGIGEIESDYFFDDTKNEYKNSRKVKWSNIGEWNLISNSKFSQKVLTEITPYPEFIKGVYESISQLSDDKLKSNKEIIGEINSYIKNQGYNYTYDQLSNLYLSLKTKPFTILAGISGTGKSKIIRLLADGINADYTLISVRPDWNDSSDLIGYKNLQDEFIKGQLTEAILKAQENKNKIHFVCLDEMNLARVEYYLSDYLSIIESRSKVGQDIITDDIVQYQENNENISLHIPDNLYLVGTVNMDDTTFQFSRKVLDRANTIEFSDVDLDSLFFDTDEEVQALNISNNFLKTTYLKTMDIEEEYREYAKEVNQKIIEINEILKRSQKQFAYRVRDEILFYMVENKKANLLDENTAFDYQIMQKVLPAINGSEQSVYEVLIYLLNFIFETNDIDSIDEAENYLENTNVKYENSAKKIIYMLKGYQNDGYVSYWY